MCVFVLFKFVEFKVGQFIMRIIFFYMAKYELFREKMNIKSLGQMWFRRVRF